MSNIKEFTSEREAWEILWGSGEKSRNLRKEARAYFSQVFPQGHKTDMREYVAFFARLAREETPPKEEHFKHIPQMHPDALDLLVRYGRNYRPWNWHRERLQDDVVQPETASCSLNAYRLMRSVNKRRVQEDQRLAHWSYVEGVAVGSLVFPMLHAWNAVGLGNSRARDWTFYAGTIWTRYFGIPLTQEEYERAIALCWKSSDRFSLLLDRAHFDRVRSYLEEILAARPKEQ